MNARPEGPYLPLWWWDATPRGADSPMGNASPRRHPLRPCPSWAAVEEGYRERFKALELHARRSSGGRGRACPTCKAPAGEPCRPVRGSSKVCAPHLARLALVVLLVSSRACLPPAGAPACDPEVTPADCGVTVPGTWDAAGHCCVLEEDDCGAQDGTLQAGGVFTLRGQGRNERRSGGRAAHADCGWGALQGVRRVPPNEEGEQPGRRGGVAVRRIESTGWVWARARLEGART